MGVEGCKGMGDGGRRRGWRWRVEVEDGDGDGGEEMGVINEDGGKIGGERVKRGEEGIDG